MMRFILVISLSLTLSQLAFSQVFQVQAKPKRPTPETITKMMDLGVHAIHLEVIMNEKDQLVIDSGELLSDVLKAMEWHTKSYTRYEIKYVIELKHSPNYLQESIAVHDLLDAYIPLSRITIQSENFKVLKFWNKKYPKIQLAALINNEKSIDTNLANLGFKPNIYSSDHKSLSKNKVANLHRREIKVIPWTVNDTTSMNLVIGWTVDGIVTEAPDQSLLLGVNQKVKDGN
jgi:glycerophosphoryl diester phosphodiesterase